MVTPISSGAQVPLTASQRWVIGITGATGAALGVLLLQRLRAVPNVETHLVLSRWARSTIELETPWSVREVRELADVSYGQDEQGAAISSGSFPVTGMVVIPCSMKTLAGIRYGYADGLIARAADVTLKEHRPLVLVPRETPLSVTHLENMLALARQGVRLVPPMPAYYNSPTSVDDITEHIVSRVLDQLGIPAPNARRWNGIAEAHTSRPRAAHIGPQESVNGVSGSS
ncbi:UbiX family flavin prenyltransferase [Amycolatopsis keratiniphila]|uniref:Probable UbiX-like flavin prenyltransferase n=1 Tax=Amycolatopsis keratiniphila subsp. keratiniphila TaxID=227715 RepID=A0A1W2M2W6_9PSEU|nr:UbiX family flavin prenyltransferase [Amycolatopsis keratiniphila]ONF74386.1 phenolic acid decarboxylase [Amycolatopsis keratiniphila subsp. keratiniphila]